MNKLKIIGITHKICFLDTLYELFQVNLADMGYFTKQNYESCGQKTLDHYNWLRSVFDSFNASEKEALNEMFSQAVHVYHMLNEVVSLPDGSQISDIRKALSESSVEEIIKVNGLLDIISDKYSNVYNDYFDSRKEEFDERAKAILQKATDVNFDILSFMENHSGIKFSEFGEIAGSSFPDTVTYYFTFRPIGAMGFQTAHEIISTVQGNIFDLNRIVSTPFHEFSHSLFRTFTLYDDYKELSTKLKCHGGLKEYWETKTKNHYDWDGWIEENLVQGFSKHLYRKFRELYGIDDEGFYKNGSYVVDKMFYDHLLSIGFDPAFRNLKDVSFEFLENLVKEVKNK